MRTGLAITGLVLIALGWVNATLSDRNPALLLIGCVLVLTSWRWRMEDMLIAWGVLLLPLVYWLHEAGAQPMICHENGTCTKSTWQPPDAVRAAVELVPYFLIAWLAWRLRKHDPLASGSVVSAREGGL